MKGQLPAFTVATVPFPFFDRTKTKRRPALVLSSTHAFNNLIGHSVLAMITSAKNSAWPLDVEIRDLKQTGLRASSIVRMKLFTIDHRLITSTLGRLSERDSVSVRDSIQKLLSGRSTK